MSVFRSRSEIGRFGTGRILVIALGVLASAASNAQSAASGPEPPELAGQQQSATPGADKASRSKANVRTHKLAVGGLSIPTTVKPVKAPKAKQVSAYHGMAQTAKSREFYPAAWGVDKLRANYTSSGNLIRFTFRVVQPKLAKPLGDHESSPYMFAPRAHAVLQVPSMEKIGQLRQLGNLEQDKDYWMVFSNKGNLVRPGDRVDVIIGKFHADGLLVQ